MGKGSAKGWTYASEQWRIEPFFENDALDLKIAVKEIAGGEISEAYANGMSFSVGYEAVTEPETPQTGDSSIKRQRSAMPPSGTDKAKALGA